MKTEFESYSSKSDIEEKLQEEFGLDSGFDVGHREPEYNSIEVIRSNDNIIVGFLQQDSDAQDFWENDDGAGELIQFRNADDRDDKIQSLSKSKKLFYLVNKYDHSQVHFSVSGTRSYPDERWDVSHGCAVFVPCDYIQSEFKKLKKTDGEESAIEHFVKDSNSVLDSYSKWANGEVFGYSVITFDKEGNEINSDECWGYIGDEDANSEKRNIMKHIVLNEQLEKLMENIEIETVAKDKVKLPFRIAKKDLEEIKVAHVYDTFIVAAKYSGEDNAVIYNWSEGDEKPSKSKYEQWQKNHGVTPESFLDARMRSDIKDVICQSLKVTEEKKENKPSI
jgi:hypothetical protein